MRPASHIGRADGSAPARDEWLVAGARRHRYRTGIVTTFDTAPAGLTTTSSNWPA
jgi:hypothetical protein